MAKKIEEKYRSMSDIEHCLNRPGMWIGSVRFEEKEGFLYNREEGIMKMETYEYVPGMLKLVDEIISNSCDEYRRKDNMGLDSLQIMIIDSNKEIRIIDNGGIPVVKHKEAGVYVSEFIFGQLRTSSNYDDNEDRSVIGTNGVGSSLTNIFSKKFTVVTGDGKNVATKVWYDNMSQQNEISIQKTSNRHHGTEIRFELDWDRFEKRDDNDWWPIFKQILEKRAIDAAIANPGLKVTFEEWTTPEHSSYASEWKFNDFKEYIELYRNYIDLQNCIEHIDSNKKVYIYPDGNINVGFVNGAECSKGTHIKTLHGFINQSISEFLAKKDKIDVTPRQVDGKYSMFCDVTVSNPSYSSQTKEELTTPIDKFYKDESIKFELPAKILESVTKSEIVNIVRDWYKQKQAAEDQKTIRQLNRQAKSTLKRPDKFIECNTKKRMDRELWIFEGDSAKAGFRSGRNPQTQAAYLMRGVPKNSLNVSPAQLMKNEVFSDLVTIIGLQFGKANDPKELNYGKIVIASDADVDGDKIAALLLVFYNIWPELFRYNVICRSISPIVIASKGKQERNFYSLEEFRKCEKELKGWQIKYCKGLSGLNLSQYSNMLRNPIFSFFKKDDLADSMFRKWFGKDNSDERKNMLCE